MLVGVTAPPECFDPLIIHLTASLLCATYYVYRNRCNFIKTMQSQKNKFVFVRWGHFSLTLFEGENQSHHYSQCQQISNLCNKHFNIAFGPYFILKCSYAGWLLNRSVTGKSEIIRHTKIGIYVLRTSVLITNKTAFIQ